MPSIRAMYGSDSIKPASSTTLNGAAVDYVGESNMTVHPSQYDEEDYEDEEEPTPPVPPDGGWGWVIVIASLCCNIIVDGVCFSFGIFYTYFLDYFQESRTKTAWVGSLLAGCYLTMGPITSALANKFGCRAVTIAGSILAATAFVLSTFAPNINVLIFTYGILGGIGFGLVYLPAIVIVGFYFEKRRAFATGIAVCGSGIGTFVFAPLSKLLLDNYDWKGGTLIIAGIVLNGVIFGSLFRPLEAKRRKKRKMCEEDIDPIKKCIIMQKLIEEKKRQRTISTHSLDNVIITRDNRLIKDFSLLDVKPEKVRSIRDILRETFTPSRLSLNRSKPAIPAIVINQSQMSCSYAQAASGPVTPDSGMHDGQSMSSELSSIHVNSCSPQIGGSCYIRASPKESPDQVWRRYGNSSPQITGVNDPEQHRLDVARPMYRKDIFYSGSVLQIPEFVRSNQNVQEYVNSITSIPSENYSGWCSCLPKVMRDVLAAMLDVQLMTSPTFLVLCFSSIFAMLGFFVPFMFLTDYAVRVMGIDFESASFLLSILGITNTIGRVLSGFVSDRAWADCLVFNNLALIFAGLATALVPFIVYFEHDAYFKLLALYCCIFGVCIAAFVSLRSIVLVDLLGLEKLTNAFGLLILFQGVASIVGTPLTGWFSEVIGSYDVCFYTAGTLIALSGIICLPLRRLSRWEERRNCAKQLNELPYDYDEDVSQETVL